MRCLVYSRISKRPKKSMQLRLLAPPSVSHLFFADDTLLLSQATVDEAVHLKHAISLYEQASGQLVNFDKSGVVFSPNILPSLRDSILNNLGMKQLLSRGKYLGLPSVSGRKKQDLFQNIINRIQDKVEGWNGKLLSKGGNEILIKSVLQSIPSYTMSCFKFPKGVLEDISSLGWRLLVLPNTLLGRVLKAKYFPNSTFLHAGRGSSPSFAWRGIHAAKTFLLKGIGRSINLGRGTSVIKDEWIPGLTSADVVNTGVNLPQQTPVSHLIDSENRAWRMDLLADIFPPQMQQAILSLPLGNCDSADKWKWLPSSSGNFTTKSAYEFIFYDLQVAGDTIEPVASSRIWKIVWGLKIPPRMIHLMWRCLHDALPFADTLARRGILIDNSCPFWESGPSSARHLFFTCMFSTTVWSRVGIMQQISAAECDDTSKWFSNLLTLNGFNVDIWSILCYFVRYYRNRAIFEGVVVDVETIYKSAVTLFLDYQTENAWPERFPQSICSRLWAKAPARGLRVYFDGALGQLSAGGSGVFVTNEMGILIHGASKYYHGIDDPLVIELIAIRNAISVANKLQLHSFSLLGDSQIVVQAVLGEIHVPSICMAVLDEVRNLLLDTPYLGVHWVRGSGNLEAHDLAFHAKSNINCNESWSSIPDVLLSIRAG